MTVARTAEELHRQQRTHRLSRGDLPRAGKAGPFAHPLERDLGQIRHDKNNPPNCVRKFRGDTLPHIGDRRRIGPWWHRRAMLIGAERQLGAWRDRRRWVGARRPPGLSDDPPLSEPSFVVGRQVLLAQLDDRLARRIALGRDVQTRRHRQEERVPQTLAGHSRWSR